MTVGEVVVYCTAIVCGTVLLGVTILAVAMVKASKNEDKVEASKESVS